MLTTYYLDHPQSGESQVLGGWSYVWAALFGPIYVFVKGFRMLSLVMLGFSMVIVVLAFLALSFAVSILDEPFANVLSIAIILVVAVAAQSSAGVELVRYGLIRRGWREGYY